MRFGLLPPARHRRARPVAARSSSDLASCRRAMASAAAKHASAPPRARPRGAATFPRFDGARPRTAAPRSAPPRGTPPPAAEGPPPGRRAGRGYRPGARGGGCGGTACRARPNPRCPGVRATRRPPAAPPRRAPSRATPSRSRATSACRARPRAPARPRRRPGPRARRPGAGRAHPRRGTGRGPSCWRAAARRRAGMPRPPSAAPAPDSPSSTARVPGRTARRCGGR